MKTERKNNDNSVYAIVTKEIISRLVQGDIPWRQKWCSPVNDSITGNFVTGKPYSLLNKMLLGKPGKYITFNQMEEKKAHLKESFKTRIVTYSSPFIPKKNKDEAEKRIKEGLSIRDLQSYVFRYYKVWHIDDVEGLKIPESNKDYTEAENCTASADMLIRDYQMRTGLKIGETDTDKITTDISNNTIILPKRTQFKTEEQFYNTLFAEMIRASLKHDDNKEESKNKAAYRDLTAEIAASMIMSSIGLEHKEAKEDTAAECKKWINVLSNDLRMIVTASANAEKAAKEILQPLL